jgi:hypothetical protein
MADGPRKAFGDYQGQRVNPLPEGFLQSYANVAKNISDLGENVGKGIGGAIAVYKQNLLENQSLQSQLEENAPIANTVVSYLRSQAKDLATKSHEGITKGLGDGSTDIVATPESHMGIIASEAMFKQAKAIEDYYAKPDNYTREDKFKILGSISSAYAGYQSALSTQDKALDAEGKKATIEYNRARTRKIYTDEFNATSPTLENAKTATQNIIAQSTHALSSAQEGQTPEQATARANDLIQGLNQALSQNDLALKAGQPAPWKQSDIEQVKVEIAGLQAYASAVSPEEIKQFNDRLKIPVVKNASDIKSTIDDFNQSIAKIGKFDSMGMPSVMGQVSSIASQDIKDKLETFKLQADNWRYYSEGVGELYSDPLYKWIKFGDQENAQREFVQGVLKRRVYAQTISALNAVSEWTDKNGLRIISKPSTGDVDNVKHVVELGGLGMMDENGQRWKINNDGRLEAEMDKEWERIIKLKPEERSDADWKYIRQAKYNSDAVKAHIGSRTLGYSSTRIFTGNAGSTVSFSVAKADPIIHVRGEPTLSIYAAGTMNDSKDIPKIRAAWSTQNKLANDCQDIILLLAKPVMKTENGKEVSTGIPDRDKNGNIIPKLDLTEDERKALAIRFYNVSKEAAKGTGRLTDKHYGIVSTFMGTPKALGLLKVDGKFPAEVADALYKDSNITPADMIRQLREVQGEVVDGIKSQLKTGIDVYNVDESNRRTGSIYHDHGMWNHGDSTVDSETQTAIPAGTPIAARALKLEETLIADNKTPTEEDKKVIKATWNALNTELKYRIIGTGNPNDINEVAFAWERWHTYMIQNKVNESNDNPARRAFEDACLEQGATTKSLKFYFKYANSK